MLQKMKKKVENGLQTSEKVAIQPYRTRSFVKHAKSMENSQKTESLEELGPSEFSTAITKIAVAQICQSVGFKAAEGFALETLTDVAARYLQLLGKYATASAISTGRTQSNLLDIVCSLEELHSGIGFISASNLSSPLLTSSILVDMMNFVKYTRETPFAKPIPRRNCPPVLRPELGSCNFVDNRSSHIPRWLPAFPDLDNKEKEGEKSAVNSGQCEPKVGLNAKKMLVGRDAKKRELPLKRTRVSFKMASSVKGINRVGTEVWRPLRRRALSSSIILRSS